MSSFPSDMEFGGVIIGNDSVNPRYKALRQEYSNGLWSHGGVSKDPCLLSS